MKAKFILILLVLLAGCDPVDDKLIITNQSDDKVYYMTSPMDLGDLYREILKEQRAPITYQGVVDVIGPKISRNETMMGRRGRAWENYVRHTCKDGKLRIYTFSLDTLKKYSLENIGDSHRYLSKQEFSIDDLNKLNWEVKLP